MSAREQLFAVIDAALAAIPGIDNYERMPSGDPDGFPALAVYDRGEAALESETGAERRTLVIAVEGYVEGYSGAGTHSALSDLHSATVVALMEEPPLQGLAETVDLGDLRVDVAELAEERRLGFVQDFEITFATVRGDPSQFA